MRHLGYFKPPFGALYHSMDGIFYHTVFYSIPHVATMYTVFFKKMRRESLVVHKR